MLRAFGHRVAMCCDMLGVVGSILTIFKFAPTTPNTSRRIAIRWRNARNMLRPTALRHVALACCDRLAGTANAGPTMLGYVALNVAIVWIPFCEHF